MDRTIKARFSRGKIEPLEPVDLQDGQLVTVTIKEEKPDSGAFERAAGGWVGLVDTDSLLRDFKKSRELVSPDVEL